MNSTPDVPRSSTPADDGTAGQHDSAGDASDGLAGAGAAEQFSDAVEHRLSSRTFQDSLSEGDAPGTDLDEDNPVRIDNPE